jgi:eukaryotic-like serine/threonine-protein kinase
MDEFRPGTIVADKFRIERELGGGGMGRVYVAEQLSVGRRVALKIMCVPQNSGVLAAETFERRFFL